MYWRGSQIGKILASMRATGVSWCYQTGRNCCKTVPSKGCVKLLPTSEAAAHKPDLAGVKQHDQ